MDKYRGIDWPYFSDEELRSPDVGYAIMQEPFMERVILLREDLGVPLIANSGYRSRDHNRKIGGRRHSAHLYGVAIDVKCLDAAFKHELVAKALEYGMTGIGVYPRFVHMDRITHCQIPKYLRDRRPAIWPGK